MRAICPSVFVRYIYIGQFTYCCLYVYTARSIFVDGFRDLDPEFGSRMFSKNRFATDAVTVAVEV